MMEFMLLARVAPAVAPRRNCAAPGDWSQSGPDLTAVIRDSDE